MKHYLLNVYQPNGDPPPPEFMAEVARGLDRWNAELRTAGAWVFAARLNPASAATVVRDAYGEAVMTDGPFAEGKEHVGGFVVIRASDLDAALEWGRRLSEVTTLPIEVRPMQDPG